MAIAIGILAGLVIAGGVAYLIAVSSLCKSNDFGDETVDLQQFTGYDPISCENVGQESSSFRF